MGNACARGNDRSDIDSMQAANTMHQASSANSATNSVTTGMSSSNLGDMDPEARRDLNQSTNSYTSSYGNAAENNLLHSQKSNLSIEDFQLIKVVGRGSFGKVYLAKKKDTGKIYAIKTLKKDFIIRTNQVNNTKIERDIMQQITHPFVVKLHFAFQSSECLYFVTDFLNGGELFFHLCNEIRFSEDRARFYAA